MRVLVCIGVLVILAFDCVYGQVAIKGEFSNINGRLKKSLKAFSIVRLPNIDNELLLSQAPLVQYPDLSAEESKAGEDVYAECGPYCTAQGDQVSPDENIIEASGEKIVVPDESVVKMKVVSDQSEASEGDGLSRKEVVPGVHSGAFVFGRGITVDIDVVQRGTWFNLTSGLGRVLKLGIKSPTARSLNLLFDNFWLPEGAELYVHGQSARLGAYTGAVNNKHHRRFATTPLPGSSLIIEYYSPAHVSTPPVLHITSIVHGFRGVLPTPNPDIPASFGSAELSDAAGSGDNEIENQSVAITQNLHLSGDCNVNAPACPEAAGWKAQIDSVAIVMTANGQKFCTGATINNARRNGRQLFLTADHCITEFNSDFSYNILGFNYQSKECRNNYIQWPLTDTVQGLSLLARSKDSDFALFEIQERIPESYNVYMAGWSTSAEIPKTVTTIHHPSGDVKKISLVQPGGARITMTCWEECPLLYHFKVNSWSVGVTEPGSSGAPLFNADGLIIGQLHGGDSSCSNPSGYDSFGALFASCDATKRPEESLYRWLNPRRVPDLREIRGAYLNQLRVRKGHKHEEENESIEQ